MYQFPMKFKAEAQSKSGTQSKWTTGTGLTAAIPPEFNGPGGGYSPEDFFALSLANCFVATFKVIAEKSKFDFKDISVVCDLEVDRNEAGRPWMARALVTATLAEVAGEGRERALRLLEKVSGQCLVHQSVKTEIKYEFKV